MRSADRIRRLIVPGRPRRRGHANSAQGQANTACRLRRRPRTTQLLLLAHRSRFLICDPVIADSTGGHVRAFARTTSGIPSSRLGQQALEPDPALRARNRGSPKTGERVADAQPRLDAPALQRPGQRRPQVVVLALQPVQPELLVGVVRVLARPLRRGPGTNPGGGRAAASLPPPRPVSPAHTRGSFRAGGSAPGRGRWFRPRPAICPPARRADRARALRRSPPRSRRPRRCRG